MRVTDAKHTPGPWELDIGEYGFRIRMGSAVPYKGIYEPQHLIEWDPGVYYAPDYPETDAENRQYREAEANARRIVAAVNAVDGIATENLESGVVREMIEALELVLYQFDTPGYRHKLAVEKTRDVLRKLRGEASSTATNHDEEYEEWLRRAEEERYYNEYGREA